MDRRRRARRGKLATIGLADLTGHDWRRWPTEIPPILCRVAFLVLAVLDYLRSCHGADWEVSAAGMMSTVRSRINGRGEFAGVGIPRFIIAHVLRFEHRYRALLSNSKAVSELPSVEDWLPERSNRIGGIMALDHTSVTIDEGCAAGTYEFSPILCESSRGVPVLGISSHKASAADCAELVYLLPEGVRSCRFDTEAIHGSMFSAALYANDMLPLRTQYGCHDNVFVERFHRTLKSLLLAEAKVDPKADILTLATRVLDRYHKRWHRGLGAAPRDLAPEFCRLPRIVLLP